MPSDAQPTKRRWPRRIWRALVMFVLVLAGALGAAWWQRDALLEYGVGEALQADAVVSGFQPGGVTRVGYVHITDPEDADDTPAFAARNMSIHLGDRTRYLSEVDIEELAVSLVRTPNNNHEFLTALTQGEGGGGFDSGPYLPESVRVRSLPLRISAPGGSLSLDGLGVSASLYALSEAEVVLRGEAVSGKWMVPGLDLGWREVAGALNGRVSYKPDAIEAEFKAELPGLAEGAGRLSWTRDTGLDAAVQETHLTGGLWLELVRPWLPVEATFDSVHIAEANLNATYEAAVKGDIEGLRVGPPDAPWYAGPVSVDLTGAAEPAIRVSGDVELSDGAKATVTYEERDGGAWFEVEANAWPRPLLAGLARASGTNALAVLPNLAAAEWSGKLAVADTWAMDLKLEPEFDGGARAYPLTAKIGETPEGGWSVEAEMSGGQQLSATFAFPPDGVWNAKASGSLGEDAAGFLRDWFGLDFTEWLALSMDDGSLALTKSGETTVMAEAVLSGSFTELGPLAPSAATPYLLNYKGNYQTSNALADGGRIDFEIPDQGTFSSSNAQIGGELITMGWKSEFDLEDLLPMLGIGDLSGTASATGGLRYAGDTLAVTGLTASLGSVNYAGALLPSEHPLEIAGDVQLDTGNGSATGDLAANWGSKTKLESTGFRFDMAGGALQAQALHFSSDLRIAIGMGWVKSGDARLEANAENLVWDDVLAGGTAELLLDGGLVLPDDMLAMSGMHMEAYANLENGGTGAGPFRAEEIAAFGASFREVSAQVRLAGPQTFFEEGRSTLWGGTVVASGRANVFTEPMPLSLDARVSDIDLALFSEAFDLPYGELTGIVSGHIRASIEGDRITALDADLVSEENFTMSRQMVVEALMSQDDAEVSGSKLVSGVVAKVIGEDEQRPFDRARIRLGLSGERITGIAELNSPRLNLTVDIVADQAALLEVVSAAQEGKIEQFQTRWQ